MGKWWLKFGHGILLQTKLAFLCISLGSAAYANCSEKHVDLRWDGGSARFAVEVADDDQERAKGLMFRKSMPKFAGMLFVYDTPREVGFWMRNTHISLDMLFFDETGALRSFHKRAKPLDETVIQGGPDIQYILEINGGLVEALKMKAPIELRHPVLESQDAVWPCS